MALPSSTIGFYDFGNQYRAGSELAQGSRQIANQMVNLGASISASLTENNQRKEAQQLAPQLAQTYQQGFQDIFNGNPSGGLSTIYGASMSASQNPFLAKMAESATTAANWATNNFMKQQMQANSLNAASQLAQDRNDEYNRRFGMQNEEYDRRFGMRQDTTENKPLTPLQKFNANNTFNQSVSKVFEDLDAASTDAEFNSAKTRLKQMIQGAKQIGLSADIEGVFAQASPEEREKIKAAQSEMNDLEKDVDNHWEWTGGKQSAREKLVAAKAKFESLKSATESALKRERDQFEKEINTVPSDDLPSGPVGNEDVIPLVPGPNQLTQGTPAQQQMQSEEQEQSAILQQVQQGQLTREQAIEIARQRGW